MMMTVSGGMLIPSLFVCAVWTHCSGQDVIVDTEYGQVQGKTINVYNGRENKPVHSFHAIPFAQDTSGANRFRNPVPRDPWSGVYIADTPGPACHQTGGTGGTGIESEDCLHLDIVSPDVTGGPYPVMVWIYGGSYQWGLNVDYPGHFLATHDVVVAVVNYRLGKFGFAYTGNAAAPGNAGLWDQRMGIQFVVDNIANFGGDPNRITVFGESAGATSASFQMLSPQSKDLFHQAITESGGETNDWAWNPPESNPENYIHQIAGQLGCDLPDDMALVECLRQQTVNAILNTDLVCTPGFDCMGMAPVVDGPGGFLPERPVDLRASGDIMRGPLMSTIMADDGALFVPSYIPGTIFDCCSRSYFLIALREYVVGIWSARFDNVTEDNHVHALDFNYAPWPYVNNNDNNLQSFVRMTTDMWYGYHWDYQIKGHSEIAPTYAFVFDYRGAVGNMAEWMGVTHGDEIKYVFGTTLLELNPEVQDDSLLDGITGFSERDRDYTYYVQTLFANFARTGNPTPEPVENPFGGSTVWPTFTFEEMNVLHMTNVSADVVLEWEQKNYAFWTHHMNYLTWGN